MDKEFRLIYFWGKDMNEEEFLKYKEKIITELRQYREEIEEFTDATWLDLETLWEKHRAIYIKWQKGEGYPSYPVGAFHFLHHVDKELSHVISHLGETSEWRILCALGHFDGLLSFIDKKG